MFTIATDGDEYSDLHNELDAGSHHGWAAAHLFDEPAAVAAFETLVERIGFPTDCSEWPVAGGRRFGDGPTDAVSLESRHATLDLNLTISCRFESPWDSWRLLALERGWSHGLNDHLPSLQQGSVATTP